MTVETSDGDLLLRFDLQGSAPNSLDALYTTLGYYFLVDIGDDQDDYMIDMSSVGGWEPNLFDVEAAYNYGGVAFPGSGCRQRPTGLDTGPAGCPRLTRASEYPRPRSVRGLSGSNRRPL